MKGRAAAAWIVGIVLAGCSDSSPAALGSRAALAEKTYFVFGDKADIHAATLMKAWHQACALANNDMQSTSYQEFVRAYVAGLQSEPGAATTKPLQKYVREKWWTSGVGCTSIAVETPDWAIK